MAAFLVLGTVFGARLGPWLAQFLAGHTKVVQTHYPGLTDHPQHELAKRQMNGFGGVISFRLGSLEKARTLLNSVELMALAESLGGVETLISHPASMTHASVPAEQRQRIGVTDDLVRVSVEGVDSSVARNTDAFEAKDRICIIGRRLYLANRLKISVEKDQGLPGRSDNFSPRGECQAPVIDGAVLR